MKKLLALLLLISIPSYAQEGPALEPFFPIGTASLAVTIGSSSASSATALTGTELPTWQEYCVNTGTAPVFVAFGVSTVSATTSSIPIPTNTPIYFTLNEGQQYISGISATGSATLYCVGGRGGH